MRPRRLEAGEALTRDRIADRFRMGFRGLLMERLSALCRVDKFSMQLTGISRQARRATADVVPIALSFGLGKRASRAVLGIELRFSHQLVNMALGRSSSVSKRALSSGEQGVLLYVLDRAGGDWIESGGGEFVVRGILADRQQVADYLGRDLNWEVSCQVTSSESEGNAWLWLTDSIPPAPWTASIDGICEGAADWEAKFRISVGWARLKLEDVERLEAGDLILPDEICFPGLDTGYTSAQIYCGGWRRNGKWIDRRNLEISSEGKEGIGMQTKENERKGVRAELKPCIDEDAGEMEVVVRVEVGRVTLTVDQALGLVPGRVLRLERGVEPEVVLRIGEKLVARGDLVEYEGGLAVEVAEVL